MDPEQRLDRPVPATLALDRSRKVRLRLGRSLVPLLLAAVVLCAMVVWHRDATHITKACDRIEPHLVPIRRYLAQNKMLPAVYPTYQDLGTSLNPRGFTYVAEPIVRWARTADRRVLIGYGPNNGLIVRPNGHAVAIYENGAIHVEWMAVRELQQLLDEQQRLVQAHA